jgi:ribose transport system substrate-binding protein
MRFFLLVAMVGGLVLTSCEKVEELPEVASVKQRGAAIEGAVTTVAVCLADGREPFYAFQLIALRAALGAVDGMQVESFDAAGSAEREREVLQQLLIKKPRYLLLAPVDVAGVKDLVGQLMDRGTRVIGLDERMRGQGVQALAYVDQKAIGRQAAQAVIDALRRRGPAGSAPQGKVLHVLGREKGYVATARAEGFREGIKSEPNIQVVHEVACEWDKKLALERTKEALAVQVAVDVVVAQNDYMAEGCSEALVEAKLRECTMVIGMDALGGELGGIDLIVSGVIDGSVHQGKPIQCACEWILEAEEQKASALKSGEVSLPLRWINAANVDEAVNLIRTGEL